VIFCNTLTLFDRRGKKLWTIGGLDKKTNKPLLPDKYRFGAFSADGKNVVVLTDKKVQVIDAKNGVLGKSIDLPSLTSAPLGENLLISDGESKLKLFSPAQEKVLSELDFAKAGPVTFALAGRGIVVGTEVDGTVRLVKAINGKLAEQTVWQNKVYTKIVKQVAVHGDRIAVTYWGGTLRIFDAGGKLRSEQVFSQDISALVWSKDQWIAGLADGRLVAGQAGRRPR
jgi:WD40 repeat protein